MLQPPLTISPGAAFWTHAAQGLLAALPALLPGHSCSGPRTDFSGVRVVVPTFAHAHQLRGAMSRALGRVFIPPRICTLHAWLALQAPTTMVTGSAPAVGALQATGNERLMLLYAELRHHAWLKKLFSARRNTDLLPLAQTLLALADELTGALLPALGQHPDEAEARWDAALAQLPPAARTVLSDEAQLVWSIWKTQLDADDPGAALHARLMALAAQAATPLVWITPVAPDACTQAFLNAWGERQPVLPVMLGWDPGSLAPSLRQAWPELIETAAATGAGGAAAGPEADSDVTSGLSLSPAGSLEEEALCGAQTILDWLAQGRLSIAIVAQDRVVARRIRALLQRARVEVADETGWKLSTTRAASALAAWFDVVTSRAESSALLDFLKSPFLVAADDDRAEVVMAIELALRRANVAGGWRAVLAVAPSDAARQWLQQLAAQADTFRDRHTIAGWISLTNAALHAFGIDAAYAADAAGKQVIEMLEQIDLDCTSLTQTFSFAEWRAYVSLQMESSAFVAPIADWRVMMLPLNATHLRSFDAVLVVGADATHLPSLASETLFFANAVRRELGLATRETRRLQQLRDFAALLAANRTVVISWQSYRDGEPNPVSSWVARLELALARNAQATIARHLAPRPVVRLMPAPVAMPAPAAPDMLPEKLSASGYATLIACPYQFFATRMLGLSGLDEFSDQPEKRDYGDWLHQILDLYHAGVRDHGIGVEQRAQFLQQLTQQVFAAELARSGAALGYHDRWQKAMPAYLAWANEREAQGWSFVSGEEWRQQPLRWDGGEIQLHGRIDRIDCNASGEVAVLDYKTTSLASLKKRIEGNEDHQLAFYGLLSAIPTGSASFVALEPHKEKIDEVAAPDYAAWQQRLHQQIGGALQAIATGAGLRASGIESACQYCQVRGLCRKGAW